MDVVYEKVSTPSKRLRDALDYRGMKPAELAASTGLGKSSISGWLAERYEPKHEALYKMGIALDVSEMWLAGYDVPMERPVENPEFDTLAQLMDRFRHDEQFKQLIVSINRLNPQQLTVLQALVDALPQEQRS